MCVYEYNIKVYQDVFENVGHCSTSEQKQYVLANMSDMGYRERRRLLHSLGKL